nr:MFS transporter [Staphylococcus lugdunensis]
GVAGVIGTSLGGVFADKWTSKRWLTISIAVFVVMMVLLNIILPYAALLLIGIFVWNIMQWSTNPAIQSGLIEQVEGDTSQVMSWNMSALNAGIGIGGMIGGLVVSQWEVSFLPYVSAAIGLAGLIITLALRNHYINN